MPDAATLVRPSAIAGRWYPGSEASLRREVERYLAAAPARSSTGRVCGLIAPHAGYSYSGPTAARAFAQVRGAAYDRVVLLGPLHRPIPGARHASFMVPGERAYRTPLGDVPIDRALLDRLGEQLPLQTVKGDEEHSLEIELPFLQVCLGAFTLAPIMLGDFVGDPGVSERIDRLADALASLADDRTLFVASTDLSHLDDYAAVRRVDERLAGLLAAFDVDGAEAALASGAAQACGATGLIAVLRVCQRRGAVAAEVLQYTSSGDVTGDRRPGVYTVGYLAAVIAGP